MAGSRFQDETVRLGIRELAPFRGGGTLATMLNEEEIMNAWQTMKRRRRTSQRGQGMTEYIIVLQTLYSCGFQEVAERISIRRPKLPCPKLDTHPALRFDLVGPVTTFALRSRR